MCICDLRETQKRSQGLGQDERVEVCGSRTKGGMGTEPRRQEFWDCWIEQEGCTYIHLEQFPINRINELTEGGAYLDEDSLTEELEQAIRQFEQQKAEAFSRGMGPSSVEAMISVAAEVANKKIPLFNAIEKPVEISQTIYMGLSC